MRHIMRFIALATLLLLGATEINAQVADGDIKITAKGGAMTASVGSLSEGKYRVTLTATPNTDYTISAKDIVVYPLVNPAAVPQRRGPGLADALAVHDGASANIFYFDLPERYHGAMVTATFQPPVTPGTYVLHNSSLTNGYLSVKGANVTLDGNSGLQYANLYDKGNAFWVITKEGYLQNNVYYLNVANNQTLYLSVNPVTQWQQEKITDDEHGKTHIKYNDLYLCNNGSSFTLKQTLTETDSYYNACPVTITEKSWSGPTNGDLAVQSPQLVTYLRYYFTQKIDYVFYDDGGTQKTESAKDRFVYAKLEYASGGDAKGTKWDITDDGIIYNRQTSGDVAVTATYNMKPADAEALKSHESATQKAIKLTLKPQAFAPDPLKNYLLYSIPGGDSYRFPYDDGIAENGTVKSNGKKSDLTDPDVSGGNAQISWKIVRDDNGLYTFQNASSNRYIYYNDALGDYGKICVGSNTLPTGDELKKYKFRLYQTSSTDFGTCYYIIPYDKQFAVYKNDALAGSIYCAMNEKSYTSDNSISLRIGNDDSKWCIYKYEAEYRVRTDFTFSGPASTDATGNVTFTSSDGWYGKYVTESPKTGNGQKGLVVSGSYNTNKVNYIWTVIGLDDYIDRTGWTSRDGGYGQTFTNNKTFTFNVSSLPISTASGTVQLQLRGGENDQNSTTNPYKYSGKKTLGFTILSNGTVVFTDISSLSDITSSSGAYRLTADVSYTAPGVTTFSGILDCNNKTISGLTVPLFTTLTNGTVCNLNLSGVDISQDGQVGAIACVANGGSRIYNVGILSGSVSSTSTSTANSSVGCCGGLVGLLDGSARVINCFSYANITGGNRVGGIVGYNNFETKSSDARTMVMNCMFYGDITGGSSKAPIYNGNIITNRGDANGVSNFNYFWAGASYVQNRHIDVYNCALAAETRFLQRFEFFRNMLNSNRELAAWWATGSCDNKDEMMKWVLEPSQIGTATPYPILKAPYDSENHIIKYPSVVNYSPNETAYDGTKENRNKGQKLTSIGNQGKLSVTIQNGTGGPTTGASISTSSLSLTITDKDPDHFNFNYGKVQLPYYNDVGTGNYTDNKVVTGWELTVSGGTRNFSDDSSDASASVNEAGDITLTTPYNFADRKSTEKDNYDTNGNRIFNQGAYFDVPEGVTSITIKPHWANCVYVSDAYPDVVYNQAMSTASNVTTVGGGERYKNDNSYTINGSSQKVYTTMANAVSALSPSGSVYDNAIVLVGNVHSNSVSSTESDKPFTIMSIDLDKDNEPDYSYILRFDSRVRLHPVRVDFINIIGLGMAQKSNGGTGTYNFGILQPLGWFESTNTSLFRFTQFEYDKKDRVESPMILQGGVIEQWVTVGGTETTHKEGKTVTYYHVGGNVWFKEFHIGVHQDKTQDEFVSPHPPISVTGGDFNEFYLTGLYNTPNANYDDNAECYINGGHFGKVAGTGMQGIGVAGRTPSTDDTGNIIWQIDNADIDEFYAGGINAAHIAEGNIYTVISNSRVDQFCGGPKFGDMNSDKKVVTNATNCTFRAFFGAGYGGNSYNRRYPANQNSKINIDWNDWVSKQYTKKYDAAYNGVETRIDYQFLPMSGNTNNVCRLFVDYVSFSLATTYDVTSKLTGCTITKNPLGSLNLFEGCIGNFYGGGSLGKVDGNVKSTLTNCKVEGSAFGAGYSATLPTVAVMNNSFQTEPYYDGNLGAYLDAVLPATETYTWQHAETVNSTTTAINTTDHILYTTEDLTTLGTVTGNATLTINGNTVVDANGKVMEVSQSVYGGGEESGVDGSTEVTIKGGSIGSEGNGGVEYGNVYGGGKGKRDNVTAGLVKGNTKVTIQNTTVGETTTVPRIYHNVYGGGAYGSVGDFNYDATTGMPTGLKSTAAENSGKTQVEIKGGTFGWNGKENGMVFGSSRGDVGAPNGIEDKMAWVYDTEVKIGTSGSGSVFSTPTIMGSVYGGGENGHNFNNSNVYIYSGTIGITDTNVDGGAAYLYRGNVYGGGCGTDKYYSDPTGVENPYDGNGDTYNPLAGIVRGNATVTMSGGHVVRNVYGAGAMGSVGNSTVATSGKTTINISGGRIGHDGNNNDGNVFGAARGEYGTSTAASGLANVRETEVNISYPAASTPATDNDGKTENLIAGSVFGGGEAGTVKGSVAVNMTGGLILKDVYGGGALADTQTDNWDSSANSGAGGWANTTTTSTANTTVVNLLGGTIAGEAYGGGLGEAGKPAYVYGDTKVNLNGMEISEYKDAYATILQLVDGNNDGDTVDEGVDYYMSGVRGCAVHEVFGCNNINGTPMGEAKVHVFATQNKITENINSRLTFTEPAEGKLDYWNTQATNLGLTPSTIIGEATTDEEKIKLLKVAVEANRYDVLAVYGGGNLSAYEPVKALSSDEATKASAHTNVIIDGCGFTSIQQVYGGGNAASTPATNVTVNGTYEIEEVFGGGNGKDKITVNNVVKDNPGANVGFRDYSAVEPTYNSKEKRQEKEFISTYTYGSGQASVNIFGGKIHRVFGGSNTKGNVRFSAVTMLEEASGCEFCVDEAYGGGKSAPMDAEAKLLMACIPGLDAAYGGAEAADIMGDVTLNITNGTFDRVFGGNNLSGTISGSIKVNIDEVGCRPIIIGELYGGGNQAPYSVFGYKMSGTKIVPRSNKDDGDAISTPDNPYSPTQFFADPEVNANSFTSIGKIYGGGFGSGATMVGSPTVNINVAEGRHYQATSAEIPENYETPNGHYPVPSHASGKIGAINDVFGGGNAAKVIGNTNVNIGTEIGVEEWKEVSFKAGETLPSGVNTRSGTAGNYTYTPADGEAQANQTYYMKFTVKGVDIRGNVYGGGNNADVTGNTNVQIGKKM